MGSKQETKKGSTTQEEEWSPEDIGQYRATAQQNSIDALRAAEERYEKAKQSGAAAMHDTKETVAHGLGATTAYLSARGTEAKGAVVQGAKTAAEKAKDVTVSAGESAAGYAKLGAVKAKDVTVSTGQSAAELAKQGAVKAKDAPLGSGKSGTEEAKDATDAAGQKAGEKKDA